MNRNIGRFIRQKVLMAILAIFLYILLHEFGHVIVLWSVGADITEFSIASAHVNYLGGEWTDISDRWMHLNGAVFPVIIAALYMFLYRRDIENSWYRIFSGFVVLIPVASLLAWVILPFFYVRGQAPVGDDVTKFLYNFTHDYSAYWVSLVALLVIAASIAIALWKGIIQNFVEEVKKVRKNVQDKE